MKRLFRLTGRPGDVERDVADEIRFHFEMRVRELVASGMPLEDAERAAARTFGDRAAIEAALRDERHDRARRRRRRELAGDLRRDAAFAWRSMLRTPAFTISALLTLAVAIGATTALFTVVNGVLLRGLPYPNAERLVAIWTTGVLDGRPSGDLPFSAANFLDLESRSTSVARMAAFRPWSAVIGEGETPSLVPGARVTGDFFDVLGLAPGHGRLIARADDAAGAGRVVVLGHDLWRRRFGGDGGVVGRQLTLSGDRYTVIGIAPPGFRFPRGAELPSGFQFPQRTELWVPMAVTADEVRRRGTFNLAVIGLLGPSAAAPAAERELAAAMRAIGEENGMGSLQLGVAVRPLLEQSVAGVRGGILLLFGAVALLLLIACANVVNLLLARTSGRDRELVIRTALGAGRWRIARQLVTENVLLTLAGGALGAAAAFWAIGSLVPLLPAALPRADDVAFDGRVAAFASIVSIIVGAVLGMSAARHAGRAGAASVLRARTGDAARRSRSRRALVVSEVALSLVLLSGAAALVQSLVRLHRVEPGFDASGVVTSQLLIPFAGGQSFAEAGPRWLGLFESYLDRVRALPGVSAAGGVSSLPLSGAWESTSFSVEGRPEQAVGERPEALYAVVTPGYLEAMRVPVLTGRAFGPSDRSNTTPVIVISEALARRHWPGESAIGKRVRIFGPAPAEVVGVVGDVRQTTLLAAPEPTVYLPLQQMPYPFLNIVVRSAGEAGAMAPALRRELAAVDPMVPLESIGPMQAVLDASLAQRRFGMLMIAFFAVTALILAMVGMYGVIAYGVTGQMHEIGIRMALGASRAGIFRLVLGEGARLALVGAAFGIAGAMLLAAVLGRVVEGVTLEPSVIALIASAVTLTALAATGLPARRAMRVEPGMALRAE